MIYLLDANTFIEAKNRHYRMHNFPRHHKDNFLGGADPWLIAMAKVSGAKVVTHEEPVPPDSHKIKLPNIATIFDVECLDIFDLLEFSECEFILKD